MASMPTVNVLGQYFLSDPYEVVHLLAPHSERQLTQPVGTLFLFKSIWTRSQGSQGCQKSEFFFTNKTLEFLC